MSLQCHELTKITGELEEIATYLAPVNFVAFCFSRHQRQMPIEEWEWSSDVVATPQTHYWYSYHSLNLLCGLSTECKLTLAAKLSRGFLSSTASLFVLAALQYGWHNPEKKKAQPTFEIITKCK